MRPWLISASQSWLSKRGLVLQSSEYATSIPRSDVVNADVLATLARESARGWAKDPLDTAALSALYRGLSTMAAAGAGPEGQLAQDAFALGCIGPDGAFLEIGGGNPDFLSNTIVLERRFGWRGVVFEPHPDFARRQRDARSARVDVYEVAVGRADGNAELVMADELSTTNLEAEDDGYREARMAGLAQHGSVTVRVESAATAILRLPTPHVDFLSLDIEGSELDVLESMPWHEVTIKVACVEHNERNDSARMEAILEQHGMRRVLRRFTRQDAWFVRPEVLAA